MSSAGKRIGLLSAAFRQEIREKEERARKYKNPLDRLAHANYNIKRLGYPNRFFGFLVSRF